ncbi:MAG: exosortase/archaeosortase family protein [Armatimonadetes bacterium]|nr:exosortase/archaeosortase family protein [Armatimonadota bacterium]
MEQSAEMIRKPDLRASWAAWAPAVGLIVLLAVAYFQPLKWMIMRWPLEPYSGGGMLIPPLSAYIIWLKKDHLRSLPIDGSNWGLLVLALAAALYFLGSWTGINYPYALSFLVMVWGMVLLLLGRAFARELAFPIAFLVFMLPLSSALDPFIFSMRLLATRMAAWLPIALGLPTTVNGTEILVRDYRLMVDMPCSGIRSVVALMAGGALFAYFAQVSTWRKAIIFLSSLPLAVLINTLRIDITLLMGKTFGPQAASGLYHEWAGVVVFVFGLIGLFYITRWVTPCSPTDG